MYPSIFGDFLVFVSTITAMSLWVSFSIDLRLVVLPVIPFAFAYSIFMCWSWLLTSTLFLFLLLFLGVALSGWVVIVFFCVSGFALLEWLFLVCVSFSFFGGRCRGGRCPSYFWGV